MIGTGPLPKMSRWKMSERLACGSTEKRRTRLPWRASQKALVAERVVFPSPPLPPNMTYRRSGWLSNTCLSDMTSPFYRVRAPGLSPRPHPAATTQGDPARARSEVVSTEDVGHVALAQHPALPARDLRRHVGQEPQRVVRRQDRHAQEVAHQLAERHDHEARLQLVPHLQRVTGKLVARQAVHETPHRAAQPRQPPSHHPGTVEAERRGRSSLPRRDMGAEGPRPAPPPASPAGPDGDGIAGRPATYRDRCRVPRRPGAAPPGSSAPNRRPGSSGQRPC